MRTRSVLVSVLGLAALLGSGCAYGELKQVLRAQFAAELSCTEVVLHARHDYEEGYKAGNYLLSGCGVTRTYSCPESTGMISYDDKVCSYVDGDSAHPAAAKPGASIDSGEDEAAADAPAPAATPAAAAAPAAPAAKKPAK